MNYLPLIPALIFTRVKSPSVIPAQAGIHYTYHVKNYYVYIMASQRKGTLYIGVTNNLVRRVDEHQKDLVPGFTKKYNIKTLVYYEITNDIESALNREKYLKKWNRKWKIDLIESDNPEWKDKSMPFDMERMAYGGFKTMVEMRSAHQNLTKTAIKRH